MSLAPILLKQAQLNRSTRGQWNLYASHRQHLERLLVPQAPGGRICVLGAGNCNDLGLRWLLEVYREVHLVDIDPDALARAAKFQRVDGSPRLKLGGGVDLTGLADRIGAWGKNAPTPAEISECLAIARAPAAQVANPIGGPFDRVLSPCVLSQLLTPLRDTIGESHPAFSPLLAALRRRHLALMLQLLTTNGHGVFACDLFSSARVTDLARVPANAIPGLVQKIVGARQHFSGLEPAAVVALLSRDPDLADRVANVRLVQPWLWHLSLSKTYVVYAVTFDALTKVSRIRSMIGEGTPPGAIGDTSRVRARIIAEE